MGPEGLYSGGQKGMNDFVSNFTNKVVHSFLATTVYECGIEIEIKYRSIKIIQLMNFFFVGRKFGPNLQNGKQ